MVKLRKSVIIFIVLLFIFGLIFGGMLGWMLSETKNIENSENFTEFETALPTKLLDINGEIITEFASDEKREIISYNELPQQLIDALITREDRIFFSHNGFSFKALVRAVIGKLTNRSLGGGSTLSQQIAGTLYCDRKDMSYSRKIRELWWAIQMERRYSKNEILELYLNKIYFGGGTYGVNAASKYYFGHDATQITVAEAAILVIQLSNPAFYNPFDHPNVAMERQKDVLNSMVSLNFVSKEDAEASFDDYWTTFDYTRTSSSAYMLRDDKAPWFSEYVRRELGNLIYGSDDIYTSGFTVNTTLNLEHQEIAQNVMDKYIAKANRLYNQEHTNRRSVAFDTYVPMTELFSLMFNIPQMKVYEQRSEIIARKTYLNDINSVVDIVSLITGADSLKNNIVTPANDENKKESEKTTVEGTMIALNHENGYIDALIGGSKYDSENQFIRATQARVQPGSTFKPLYYSMAIDTKKYTPTTLISDTPVVFRKADGGPYIPQNFRGEWEGDVTLYRALTRSMNVPSLKVLDGIGFTAAINRAVDLLGIPKSELSSRGFTPGYPIGLGVCSVRPVEMARAYAIFANGGKEVTPIAIRNVEDKDGNVVLNPEQDIRKEQAAKGDKIQVISPQTAYVMVRLLEQTVNNGGTLHAQDWKFDYKDANGKKYTMPAGGKTGTTQNWADAWTCGFTPYYSAAFWFGFDTPGRSLGLNITGATLAGYAWGDYFQKVHANLPYKDFKRPETGIVELEVCSVSGKLLSEGCEDYKTTQVYLEGTEPVETCEVHSRSGTGSVILSRLQNEMIKSGQHRVQDYDTSPLVLNLDFLNDDYSESIETKVSADNITEEKRPEDYDFNFLME